LVQAFMCLVKCFKMLPIYAFEC